MKARMEAKDPAQVNWSYVFGQLSQIVTKQGRFHMTNSY